MHVPGRASYAPRVADTTMPAIEHDVEARPGDGPLELVGLASIQALGAEAVVTTRRGGVSGGPYASLNLGDHVGDDPTAVAENRRRLAGFFGVATDALVVVRQVHGATAAIVDAATRPNEADALVTADPRVVVCVLVADCVPVVVLDPTARVLAVVHAGWRGTVAGVVGATVERMVAGRRTVEVVRLKITDAERQALTGKGAQ